MISGPNSITKSNETGGKSLSVAQEQGEQIGHKSHLPISLIHQSLHNSLAVDIYEQRIGAEPKLKGKELHQECIVECHLTSDQNEHSEGRSSSHSIVSFKQAPYMQKEKGDADTVADATPAKQEPTQPEEFYSHHQIIVVAKTAPQHNEVLQDQLIQGQVVDSMIIKPQQGIQVNMSRFAVRKKDVMSSQSDPKNPPSSKSYNQSNNMSANGGTNEVGQDPSGNSAGWIPAQFQFQSDSTEMKKMFVLQKEELLQMVCETMLGHISQMRAGSRIIDQLHNSKFLPKSIMPPKSVENGLSSSKTNQMLEQQIRADPNRHSDQIVVNVPSIIVGKRQKESEGKGSSGKNGKKNGMASIGGSGMNSNYMMPPHPYASVGKSGSNINSIFQIPITHSQQVVRMESHAASKDPLKMHTCDICMVSYLGSVFWQMSKECTHSFCVACSIAYLIDKIETSQVLNICCMQADCKQRIEEESIHAILPVEQYQRYIKFKKIVVLNQDPSVRWCPTLDCETYMRGSRENPCLTCIRCNQQMCFLCNQKWHEGDCESAMSKSLLEMKIKLKVESCPSCNGQIQKFSGCNHMKCWKCGYEFCWLCKNQYTKFHYQSWNIGGCPNQMFSEERLEGMDKAQSFLKAFFYFIIMIFAVIIGGTAALSLYLIVISVFAFFLPLIIAHYKYKEIMNKIVGFQKFIATIFLLAAGFFLFPVWIFLCIIPGTCYFGPEVYTYLLFIIYSEDMYN